VINRDGVTARLWLPRARPQGRRLVQTSEPSLRTSFFIFDAFGYLEPPARLFFEFVLGFVATHEPRGSGAIAGMHPTLFGFGHLCTSLG
jgi:hypothetical protein